MHSRRFLAALGILAVATTTVFVGATAMAQGKPPPDGATQPSDALIVQAQAVAMGAKPGLGGFGYPADITVLVTNSLGQPVSDLAPPGVTGGNGSQLISLPPGWVYNGNMPRPLQACALPPVQFFNLQNGLYVIRVVSHPADCPWVAGLYTFSVQIQPTATQPLAGGTVGTLDIR